MDPEEVYGSSAGQQPMDLNPYGSYQQQPLYNIQQHHQEPVYQTLTPISSQIGGAQVHHHQQQFKAYHHHHHHHHHPQHFQEYLHHHQHHPQSENSPLGYHSFVDLQQQQQQQHLQIPQSLPLSIPPPPPLPSLPPPLQHSTPNKSTIITSTASHLNSSSNSTTTTTSSSNNSQQSHCTFKWLETNFQFRSHVSISRSTIYELYQKFCSQNGFIAVCKATFGKIIRIKFPKVKSKRLGARGQSKYHYYNITFRDERKRCSMLLSGGSNNNSNNSNETSTVENQTSNHHPQLYHPQQAAAAALQQPNTSESAYSRTAGTSSWNLLNNSTELLITDQQQQQQQQQLQSSPSTTLSLWSHPQTTPRPPPPYHHQQQSNQPQFSQQANHHHHHQITPSKSTTSSSSFINHHHHHRRLTIFSNRHSALESYSHFNLNENDYHAIIQSMLSYMRLPRAEESGAVPLSNDRFVFVNLYKIHCQCLLDSALAANLAQMRHYVMHFWQQLPRSVPVYARSMAALDAHMYALLEDIYAGSVEAPVEGLRRLNTVAHLLPVWLKRTFQVVVPNSIAGGGQNLWALLEPEDNVLKGMNIDSRRRVSVGELKVEEATRWSVRIQFKVDFILGVKKINFEQLPGVLQRLLAVFDSVYEPVDTSSSSFNLENCPENFRYVHSTRPSGHLFHQTASLLWHTLLREFREMLERLLKVNTSSSSNESTSAEEAVRTSRTEDRSEEAAEQPKLSGQLLVDELDRLIQAVQGQMEALQSSSSGGQTPSSSSSSWTAANHHRLYSNLTLLFGRLVDDLLGWMAVERTLQRMDGQLVDEFVEEEEEEEEEENFEDDLENDDEGEAEAITSAQLYLLLTSMHCYLVEVCQTVLRRRRFGHLEEDAPGESG